jgi:hypothetical protein
MKPLFCALLLLALLVPLALAAPSTSVQTHYSFDDNMTSGGKAIDSTGLFNATIVDATTGVTGKIGQAYSFDGSNDALTATMTVSGNKTICFWVNTTTAATGKNIFTDTGGGYAITATGAEAGWSCAAYTNTKITISSYGGGAYTGHCVGSTTSYNSGSWTHYCAVWNVTGNRNHIYANGVLEGTSASGGIDANSETRIFGGTATRFFTGMIDEMTIFSDAKTPADIAAIYANESAGCAYPWSCSGGGSTTYSTYDLNVNDLYDNSDLAGANVTFYDPFGAVVNSSITGADGNAHYTVNASVAPTYVRFNVTKAGFFDGSGVVLVNQTNTSNISQGVVDVVGITTLISGVTLGGALGTWTVNSTSGKAYSGGGVAYPTNIYLHNGTNALTLQYAGGGTWYDLNFEINITAPEEKNVTIAGAYNALLNVTAKNAFLNTTINVFNITVQNSTYAYSQIYAATLGSVSIPAEQSIALFLFIDAANYSYANVTHPISNSTPFYEFGLYTSNSVYVHIFNEDTGAPIYDNITIVTTGTNFSSTNYTTTSLFYIDNLYDGAYTFKLSGANYTLKSYAVTVANRSMQTLNAYLSASIDTTIFTFQDESSGETLEGVSATMYRLINSTWTVVESKLSDITGRVQFTYTLGVKYKFYNTLTGYDDKIFYLDPVLFSTYSVKMNKAVTLENASDYIGVSIIYAPQSFEANTTGNFSFIISSSSGALIGYGLNLTYPGTSAAYTGSNANGGQFSHAYNLTTATGSDTFIVRYWYNSTLSGYRNFTATYHIKGIYSTTSIEALKDNRFGLGVFETVLVSILIAGVVAGVATMIAGPLIGGALGLFLLGVFVYIGFVPLWAALISFLIGFVLIVKRGD